MRCVICDANDWKNVDKYRIAPKGMAVCNSCGFISYPEKYKTEEEIKAYYKEDYRKPPQVGNFNTGLKKLHIHSAMLSDLMREWVTQGKTKPVISEIGAAFGMLLNWFKQHIPEADVNGTEYALAYRRVAFHEYGIRLDQDFDKTKKYDLIVSFKVAEHQLDIDKRLREYVEALNDGGYMYISVPTWLKKMTNFGADGFDLEYYFHPDHINVWTREHFEYLLKKVGLRIVKEDHVMYDDSYICVRDDSLMTSELHRESVEEVERRLDRIKKAAIAFMQNDFDTAVNLWENFHAAWINRYEKHRATAHNGQSLPPIEYAMQNFVDPMYKCCPDSLHKYQIKADVLMRYDRYSEAAAVLEEGLAARPNNSAFLSALCQCFRQMALKTKNPEDRISLFKEARECAKYLGSTDSSSKNEAMNWAYSDGSNIPTPHERG